MVRYIINQNANSFTIIIFLILSFTLSSCAITIKNPSYPKGWNPIVNESKESCVDISGLYFDDAAKWTRHPTLAADIAWDLSLIFGIDDYSATDPRGKIRSVSISIKEKEMTMDFFDEKEALNKKLKFKEAKDYFCKNGGIEFNKSSFSPPLSGEADTSKGFSHDSVFLTKDLEGSLIVRVHDHMIGYVYFIPLYTNGSQWINYPQKK